jgi:hypothetical protein
MRAESFQGKIVKRLMHPSGHAVYVVGGDTDHLALCRTGRNAKAGRIA